MYCWYYLVVSLGSFASLGSRLAPETALPWSTHDGGVVVIFALSTRFPLARCVAILVQAGVEFAESYPDSTLKEIRYCNFDQKTVRAFENYFDDRWADLAQPKPDSS